MSTTTTPVTNINFSSESPAAPTGQQNIVWSDDSSGDISGYLPAFQGDSGSGGLAGAVPAPAAGTAAANKFLRADGTWAAPSGSGVTSVGVSVPSVLTVSGSPVTTGGTIALGLATQSPNMVLAGPVSGAVGATPTFRALVAADLPAGIGGSSTTVALETNGIANAIQTKLNLIAGANVTLTADSTGDVTIAATETIAPLGTATSSANFSSSPLTLDASYWTGSAAATDSWTMQGAVGTGSNPSSTLSISHSGSSGSATVSVPQLYSPTINTTTVNATTLNMTAVNASGTVSAASFSASGGITTATSSTGTATVTGTLTVNNILANPGASPVGIEVEASVTSITAINMVNTSNSANWSFGPSGSAGFAGIAPSNTFVIYDNNWGMPMYIGQGTVTVRGTLSATTKNFSIPYPGNPADLLVHSCLEGPEVGVYYRGTAQLVHGAATITLPAYFEALTLTTGRTVLLTPQFQTATDAISQLAASIVANGQFSVRASDANNPSQMFSWEVKAVRSDVAALEVVVPVMAESTATSE